MSDMRSPSISDAVIRAALTLDPPGGLADVVGRNIASAVGTTPQRRAIPRSWPRALAPSGFAPFYAPRRFQVMSIAAALALLVLALVGLLVFSGSRPHLPAPFGLARPGLIAFDSGGDIYVSNADGTGRRRLTSGPAVDLQPTWAPDGTRVAFRSLYDDPSGSFGVPPSEDLVVMDADGTHRTVIATKAAIGSAFDDPSHYGWGPAWSPDSTQLTYADSYDGAGRIFVARADGTGSQMVGGNAVQGQDPIWSPDGDQIAFRGGSSDNDRGIYLMNADGSHVRLLVGVADAAWLMTWSPDGRSVAFVKRLAEIYKTQVMVVGVDGGVATPVSDATAFSDMPVWSPDGSWLAYFTNPNAYASNGQFVIVRPDGSGRSAFTPPVASGPAWSPDGKSLVGTAFDDATAAYQDSLVMIDIAGGTTIALPPREATGPAGNVIKGLASWQRLAD